MRSSRLCVALLVVAVGASGCAQLFTDPFGRRRALEMSQREYTKFVRWSDIESAADFVHPEMRASFLALEPAFDTIRVTDFDIGNFEYDENDKARVRVTYHAYSVATLTEKVIKETQQWERTGAGNEWRVRPRLEGLLEQVGDLRP